MSDLRAEEEKLRRWEDFLAQRDPRDEKPRVYGRWLVLTRYDKIVFERECSDEAEALAAAEKINAWLTPQEKREAAQERRERGRFLFVRDGEVIDARGRKATQAEVREAVDKYLPPACQYNPSP